MADDGMYERELVNCFRDAGYGAMRAPASGSATAQAVADVIFGRPAEEPGQADLGFTEHKKRNVPRVYYEADEVTALINAAATFGGRAYLGARFVPSVDGMDKIHYLVPVDEAKTTDSGKFAIHADDIEEKAHIIVNASSGEVTWP